MFLNIVTLDSETINYIDELDFAVELLEVNCIINNEILNKDDNILLRFLNLFNNNNNVYSCSFSPVYTPFRVYTYTQEEKA